MIKKIKGLILLLLLLFATSCNNGGKVYFEETYTFDYGVWPRFQHVNFDIPIEDVDKRYDMIFTVNYDQEIDYDELPVQINTESQDGEKRFSEFRMKIKGKNGEHYGVKQDDGTLTYTHVIRSNFKVSSPGTYKVDIECFYPKYNIPYINNVSVKLVKTSAPAE